MALGRVASHGPAPSGKRIVIARLVRSEDFERVLSTRSQARSQHFAVHHVPEGPSAPKRRETTQDKAELSTIVDSVCTAPVDDSDFPASTTRLCRRWLGVVVPKRHARRAVTRSLLKRQIRSVVSSHADTLAGGLWVVRLRAPFERGSFISAASDELKRTARAELERLMGGAARPVTTAR